MEWGTGQVRVLLSYTFCGRWERHKIIKLVGTSLVVQWLGLCASTAGSTGSTPGQGTKIPQATQRSGKKKKENKRNGK